MSEITLRTNFRNGWNTANEVLEDPLVAPSDIQFKQNKISALNEFSYEKPTVNKATIASVIGQDYIQLPKDFLPTIKNKKLLSQFYDGLNPYLRKQSYTNLSVTSQIRSSGSIYQEFSQTYSKPLKTSSLQPSQINIQNRNIDGVIYPVWLLYDTATSVSEYKLIYAAKHQIENALALLTVVTNPNVSDTIIISNNLLVTTTLTFVASGATTYQINIGGTTTLTAVNILAKLVELGFISISTLGNKLTVTSPDGEDFTLTVDGTRITKTYTNSINTIQDDGYFMELLKAYTLEGLTSQELLNSVSIADVRKEAKEIRTRVLQQLRKPTYQVY